MASDRRGSDTVKRCASRALRTQAGLIRGCRAGGFPKQSGKEKRADLTVGSRSQTAEYSQAFIELSDQKRIRRPRHGGMKAMWMA